MPREALSTPSDIAHQPTPADDVRKGRSPFETSFITLSSQSDAANTKTIIESYLTKRSKTVLGPSVGKVGACAVIWVRLVSSSVLGCARLQAGHALLFH